MSLRIQVKPNDIVAVDEIGGSYHYTETVIGTVANPWGDHHFSNLAQDFADAKISVLLRIGGGNLALQPKDRSVAGFRNFNGVSILNSSNISAVSVEYRDDGSLSSALVGSYYTNNYLTTEVPDNSETTLTIYYC